MNEGKIDYIVYTGKTDLESINDFIRLHHHAILLGITVLTALDTANALADIIASKFTEDNTELVDINHLRKEKLQLSFTKMPILRQRLYLFRQPRRQDYLSRIHCDQLCQYPLRNRRRRNCADRKFGRGRRENAYFQ